MIEKNIEIENELGIYIHIPFCKRKCDYCDFISFDRFTCNSKLNDEIVRKYIDRVLLEIDNFDFSKYLVTTIYMGGGTPSYIDSKYITKIISKLKSKINNNCNNHNKFEDIEITIEINPGTVNKEKIKSYFNLGINRLSIGLQSVNDKLLKQIGRIHTYIEFEDVYNMAINEGFKNINFDLIIGLPNQTIEDISETIEVVKKLNPNHVSIYSLIVEEGTKLEKEISSGKLELIDENLERQMYWYVKNKLELLGYNHYEISNFSKKGKESKHNINCWKQKEYIGFGLSAHSYINNTRFYNTEKEEKVTNENHKIDRKIYNYIKVIEEIQTIEMQEKEYMLLGLRMLEGISIKSFKGKFINNPILVFKKELEELVDQELIIIDGDNIRLTNKGLDFGNLVWEQFI